jgi:hypothetical protein
VGVVSGVLSGSATARNHIVTWGFDVSVSDLCKAIKTDILTPNNSLIYLSEYFAYIFFYIKIKQGADFDIHSTEV